MTNVSELSLKTHTSTLGDVLRITEAPSVSLRHVQNLFVNCVSAKVYLKYENIFQP